MPLVGRRRFVCGLAAAAVWLCAAASAAQTANAPALKAAFLYNVVKFTEWPADAVAPNAPLTLCVVDDSAVAEALAQATKGQQIDGHPIVVARPKADGALRTCSLLYAGRMDEKRAVEMLDAVRGAPVFAVSDLKSFALLGGTAQLYVEDGRMRFAVNLASAQRGKLRLSAQLLSLAKLVKDDPNAISR